MGVLVLAIFQRLTGESDPGRTWEAGWTTGKGRNSVRTKAKGPGRSGIRDRRSKDSQRMIVKVV